MDKEMDNYVTKPHNKILLVRSGEWAQGVCHEILQLLFILKLFIIKFWGESYGKVKGQE